MAFSHVVRQAGSRVRVFDVFVKKYGEEEEKNGRLHFIQGDLCNPQDLEQAMQGCWAVFHVASPPPLSKNRQLFERVNIEGTKTVIATCKRVGSLMLCFRNAPTSMALPRLQAAYFHEQRQCGVVIICLHVVLFSSLAHGRCTKQPRTLMSTRRCSTRRRPRMTTPSCV